MDWDQLIGIFTFWQWLILIVVISTLVILFIVITKPKKIGPIEYGVPAKKIRRHRHVNIH